MRAWQVGMGGARELVERAALVPARGGVLVRMQAAPVLSYMRDVLDGKLGYALPATPFTPGTNCVGLVAAVGKAVYHVETGDRVLVDPLIVADEPAREPAQILLGLTATGSSRFGGIADAALALQADWPNGTFAEMVHCPASVVTKLPETLRGRPAEELVALSKFAVPYGGLLRGALSAGETLVVNGATGYFGAAAVALGVALGATRVVAAAREEAALTALRTAVGDRVVGVPLKGDVERDAAAIASAAGGRVDMALDMVGRATDAMSTLAALHSLRRGGRLVLMGSVSAPLPLDVGEMLSNCWQIIGNFMYPPDAPARLAALAASGQLDLRIVRTSPFPLAGLEEALEAAAKMRGLDLTALSIPDS